MSVAVVGPNRDAIRRGIAKVAPHLAEATPISLTDEVLTT
jgi:hypothetical protein